MSLQDFLKQENSDIFSSFLTDLPLFGECQQVSDKCGGNKSIDKSILILSNDYSLNAAQSIIRHLKSISLNFIHLALERQHSTAPVLRLHHPLEGVS